MQRAKVLAARKRAMESVKTIGRPLMKARMKDEIENRAKQLQHAGEEELQKMKAEKGGASALRRSL